MVNEVNKLIFNTLVEGGALYIPEVGTLAITRQQSHASRGGRVESATYQPTFTTEPTAQSLTAVIASAASVSADEAADITRRWLQKARKDGRVVINGVGIIQNNTFTADKELLSALEQSHQVVTIAPQKRCKLPWVVLVLLLLVLAGASTYLYINRERLVNLYIERFQPAVENVATENTAPEAEVQPAEESVETAQNIATNNESNVANSDWRKGSIRHYVIYGSYSNMTNANRAVRQITRKNPAAQCEIIPLGWMYAVAVYGSYNRSDCEAFKSSYRTLYNSAWIHTPKRFR